MENGKKSIEEIRQKVENKIEKNTEYTVLMNGKVQKFVFYGLKENGRLCLLNTKYGVFTFMSAAYFIKHITTKAHLICKKPYEVEYPEDYEQINASSKGENAAKKIEEYNARREKARAEENDKYKNEALKWATRLKTLPEREEEILEKELKTAPHTLGENLEKWINGTYKGSNVQIAEAYEKVKTLLKGTAWDVK